jgi:hypothetical protein
VGRWLIVANSDFYFSARESPANVPGERKYTLRNGKRHSGSMLQSTVKYPEAIDQQ